MSGTVKLPVDTNGNPIEIGSKLRLMHNGRTITVRSLELVEGGWHVWPEEGGGAVCLPAASEYVDVI